MARDVASSATATLVVPRGSAIETGACVLLWGSWRSPWSPYVEPMTNDWDPGPPDVPDFPEDEYRRSLQNALIRLGLAGHVMTEVWRPHSHPVTDAVRPGWASTRHHKVPSCSL
jgi:hypothetical protein